MKVVLIENVPSLGKAGDVVQVAVGYGRNFLVPKRLALEASSANLLHLEKQRESFLKKANKIKELASETASQIEALSCVLSRPAGESEKIFGSVTSMDLQEFLQAQGITIDRRKIILPNPIKSLGSFSITIKLTGKIVAQLNLKVIPAGKAQETA